MSIETRIANAIEDLKAEPTALDEIAAEYGIKPIALRVRFENSYGPVEAYSAKVAETAANAERAAVMGEQAERRAYEREMKSRETIAEFFATQPHTFGRGVTNAARAYLR